MKPCVMVPVFSVQPSVIAFLQTPHRSTFQGHSVSARKDVVAFLSASFEHFRASRENGFQIFGSFCAVDFYATPVPCALVSHVTRVLRGAPYRCLPLVNLLDVTRRCGGPDSVVPVSGNAFVGVEHMTVQFSTLDAPMPLYPRS